MKTANVSLNYATIFLTVDENKVLKIAKRNKE